MELIIKNIKGAESVSLTLDPKITLVAGLNGQGKTSSYRAIAHVLAGIYPDDRKAKELLRRGASTGSVSLTDGERKFFVSFPGCKPVHQGWPKTSPYASGLLSCGSADKKQLYEYMNKLLHCAPTAKQLHTALEDLGAFKGYTKEEKEKYSANAWANIERRTWSGAHKDYEQRGRDLKAEWKAITNKTWGTAVGPSWAPEHWEDGLLRKSAQTLTEELTEITVRYEAALQSQAVSEANIESERATASAIPETEKAYQLQLQKEEALKKELADKKAAFKALPRPANVATVKKCWHCSADIDVHTFGKPVVQTAEEIEALKAALDKAEEEIRATDRDYMLAINTSVQLQQELFRRRDAQKRLLELETNQHLKKGFSAADVEDLRNSVEKARQRIDAFKRKNEADKKHQEILRNQTLIDLTNPESGWRQSFLEQALNKINSLLLEQCEIAKLPVVEMLSDLSVTFNGFEYSELSTAEQWFTDALLQIAFARLENSDLLVFDRVDLLPEKSLWRNSFFRLLLTVKIPALIFMSSTETQVPDLASRNFGSTYWLESGKTRPLKVAVC